MKLGAAIVIFLIICESSVKSELEVDFVGDGLYPTNSNATLTCEFSPIPPDVDVVEVSWWSRKNSSLKLAKSSTKENESFVYDTARPDVAPRFTTSSTKFTHGYADATIHFIQISDEASYSCDVEIQSLQKEVAFSVKVYQLPFIRIESININLDIRPRDEQVTEAQSEASTDPSAMDDNFTTAESIVEEAIGEDEMHTSNPEEESSRFVEKSTISAQELTTFSNPEYGNVTIARCVADYVYPIPNQITFTTVGGGLSWSISSGNFDERNKNEDGSFNVSARLRIEPTPDLDGKTISCTSSITDRNIKTYSSQSDVITVKYATTRINLKISPEDGVRENDRVTIFCEADGNPAPETTLEKDGKAIPLNNSKYAFAATKLHTGTYSCKTAGSKGEVFRQNKELTVHWMDKPVISDPMHSNHVTEGSSVDLRCTAASSDVVSYEWYYKKNAVTGLVSLWNSGLLRFKHLVADDSGVYVCKATTNFYQKAKVYTLDVPVRCEPTLVYSVTTSSVAGGNAYVTVTCTARGNPPCKMSLSSFGDTNATSAANNASLVVTNMLKQAKALQISCSAENKFSWNSKNVTIDDPLVCCVIASSGGLDIGFIILIAVLCAVGMVVVVTYMLYTKTYESRNVPERSAPNGTWNLNN